MKKRISPTLLHKPQRPTSWGMKKRKETDCMPYPLRSQGRTAIVTGAASGIGRGIAARLVAEDARVSLWGRDEESLSEASSEMGAEINEVTSLVWWLASNECSFGTGAVFDVSGGRATY
jgi:hypothetical protein